MKKALYNIAWFIVNIDRVIKRSIMKYRVKQAIREAVELASGSGRKHIVIMSHGRPIVVTKQKLKKLIDTRYVKKGTTIQELEKKALFITK